MKFIYCVILFGIVFGSSSIDGAFYGQIPYNHLSYNDYNLREDDYLPIVLWHGMGKSHIFLKHKLASLLKVKFINF